MDYTVQPGDCMSSIAFENGFFWKTLWNLPENAALKAKRKNPNVLMTGDIVHVPELRLRQESCATEVRHKFKRKGVPEIFKMKLLDANHKPRANLDYLLVIEGKSHRGKTDANGALKVSIPPDAKSGKLTVAAPGSLDKNGKPVPGKRKNQVKVLQFGYLNPVSELSGIKARLTNLGFYLGAIDENLDDDTKRAIRSFQRRKGLPVTGVADAATKSKLLKIHGH